MEKKMRSTSESIDSQMLINGHKSETENSGKFTLNLSNK